MTAAAARAGLVGCVILLGGCSASLQDRALAISHEEANYLPPLGSRLKGPLRALEATLEGLGVRVDTLPASEMEGAWGLAVADMKWIRVQDGLSPDGRFEVLVHEAAHLFHPSTLSRAEREVFAEVVLVRVLDYYGVDARDRSARYLALYKGGFGAIPYVKVDLDDAVKTLTGQAGAPQRWK